MIQLNPKLVGKKQYVLPAATNYVHKLDVVENKHPAHPDVISAAMPHDFYLYPTTESEELREAIAEKYRCDAHQIILTNGSDNALGALVYAYGHNRIVAITPTYPHFLTFARLYGELECVYNTAPTARDIIQAGRAASLLYLVSPNLPMGYVLSVDVVAQVADALQNTMIVIDEAYVEYGGISHIELTKRHNVTVVRTFSKAFGLAGLRIGYLITHPDNVKAILPAINDKSVTVHSIKAALAALRHHDYYLHQTESVEREKLRIRNRLDELCVDGAPIYGYNIAAGNFYLIFARDPAKICADFASIGILIRNKHDDVRNAIRIAVGLPDQNSDVLETIAIINRVALFKERAVIFDVDGTLCVDSKRTELAPGAKELIAACVEPVVVTNNCSFSRNQVRRFTGIKQVYTPLDFIKDAVVLGVEPVDAAVISKATNIVLAANQFINMETAVAISRAAEHGASLFYPTSGQLVSLDDCSDTPHRGETQIPDFAAIAGLFAPLMPIYELGKPFCRLPSTKRKPIFMIGDSLTDRNYAAKHGLVFLLVEHGHNKPGLGWILDDRNYPLPSYQKNA